MIMLIAIVWYLVGVITGLIFVKHQSEEVTVKDLVICITFCGLMGFVMVIMSILVVNYGNKKLF